MDKLSPEDAQARVRAIFGNQVEVQPVSQPTESNDSETDVVDLITRVCYFYPQYTLETAQKLADSQVTALLLQVEKQRAINFYNQVLIAAAPHTKKGELVDKLTKKYREIIEL